MRFIADRNVDRRIVRVLETQYHWLVDSRFYQGHDRTPDRDVLAVAVEEGFALLTGDGDFAHPSLADLLRQSAGVMWLRWLNTDLPNPAMRADRIVSVYSEYGHCLPGRILIVTAKRVQWP